MAGSRMAELQLRFHSPFRRSAWPRLTSLQINALQARVYADVLSKAGFEAVTVKFVRVEQADPTLFVNPAEPQVVTYNF